MKQLNIPFELGEEYEIWEFDLDLAPYRLKGYDSYYYSGNKFNIFLNYSKLKTELIFNLEILEIVLISFHNKNLQFYENLNQKISKLLNSSGFELNDNYVIQKYSTLDLKDLWCCYFNRTIYVILVECCLVERLMYTLI